jgi:hypothetical protein
MNSMFSAIGNLIKTGLRAINPFAAIPLGIKAIKYFIDSTIRDKVVPVSGSVVYCDLWLAVEHSGIYVGDEEISNIVVDGLAESTVRLSNPQSFTSSSTLGRKIYVSCDKHGAVGHSTVAAGAEGHVGERAFYGLVIKNCHQFSTKCVEYVGSDVDHSTMLDKLWNTVSSHETWEPTMGALKNAAHKKLGATKWRLWDWDNDLAENPPSEPDWQAQHDFFANQALNAESIQQIRKEIEAAQAYEAEIADENIRANIRQHLVTFRQTLTDISDKYEEVKGFLATCPEAKFSYNELKACNDDFAALAKILQNSGKIKELAHKMGRNYISEEKKK